MAPARMITESLTPSPGIREHSGVSEAHIPNHVDEPTCSLDQAITGGYEHL